MAAETHTQPYLYNSRGIVGIPTKNKLRRAFFEHFSFLPSRKIWLPQRGSSIPWEIFIMKNIARLMLATLVLLGAMSTASFADGGAPAPMCSPGHCPGK
jgi:hypothetical protein